LLEATFRDRIKQLGLAQWKIGMEKLMTEKTKKIQQIYKRLSKYEMEHPSLLLALALSGGQALFALG
jgi:hypothetical protein